MQLAGKNVNCESVCYTELLFIPIVTRLPIYSVFIHLFLSYYLVSLYLVLAILLIISWGVVLGELAWWPSPLSSLQLLD